MITPITKTVNHNKFTKPININISSSYTPVTQKAINILFRFRFETTNLVFSIPTHIVYCIVIFGLLTSIGK